MVHKQKKSLSVIGLLALLGVIAVLLQGCGEPTSEEHLQAAKALIEQSNNPAAIGELKAALGRDIGNVQARALLGKVYFSSGDYEGAEKELTRALELEGGVNRSMVVPLLSRTLLHIGEFGRVDGLEIHDLNDQARSIVLASKGLARLYQGDTVVAQEIIATAMKVEPVPPFTQLASARMALARGEYAGAERVLSSLIEQSPRYYPAWNLRGDIHASQRAAKLAEEAYSTVLNIAPRVFDARLNRAMMRIYQRDFKGAREDVQALRRMHAVVAQNHPGVNFADGILMMQAGNYVPARKAFEKTADFSYAYPLAYYYMAVIDLQQGSLRRALGEVYRFLALAPESIVGPKLAALLELEHGGYHEAEQLLRPILATYPSDVEALNLMASAKLGLGKGGQGVQLLAQVVRLQPKSATARARLGAGYLVTGETDLAISVLKRTAVVDPKFEQADILLILNYLREDKIDEAIAAAIEFKDRNPASTSSFNLLGRAYFAQKDYEKSAWAYSKALELDVTDSAARHGLAEIAIARGDYGRARHLYQLVLKYNEDDLQTQLKMASSYALQGSEENMITILEIAMDDHPESTEPILMMIRYYMAAGQMEQAGRMVDKLNSIHRDQPDALATIAGFQIATERYNQALLTLETLISIRPDVAHYHFMRAKAYDGLGDSDSAMAELARTAKLDPRHFYAKVALARLAQSNGQQGRFETLIANLKWLAPNNIDVLRMELVHAQQSGDDKAVIGLLREIYRQSPTTTDLIALAEHRFRAGDRNGAVQLTKDWIQRNDQDIVARHKLADFYVSLKQYDAATDQYRQIVRIDFDNVIALNNLAWQLLDSNPKEALRYARRAYDLSSDTPAILSTLAMAQLNNGRLAEAGRTLDRALELDPLSADLRYNKAQILYAQGENGSAREALQTALAQSSVFDSRSQAEALLKKLQ